MLLATRKYVKFLKSNTKDKKKKEVPNCVISDFSFSDEYNQELFSYGNKVMEK